MINNIKAWTVIIKGLVQGKSLADIEDDEKVKTARAYYAKRERDAL